MLRNLPIHSIPESLYFSYLLISPAPFFCFQGLGLQSQDIWPWSGFWGSQRFELVEIFGKVDLLANLGLVVIHASGRW